MDEEEYENEELFSEIVDAENAAEDAWGEFSDVERLSTVKEAFLAGYVACYLGK